MPGLKHPAPTNPRWCLHGVVVVGHQARRFTTGGVLKTGVVGITKDSLDPWQDPCGGHGLVGEVAWGRGDSVGFQCFTNLICEYLWTCTAQDILCIPLWIKHVSDIFEELFAYIHVDGRADSLFLATLVPWTAWQATWSPWRSAPGWVVQHKFNILNLAMMHFVFLNAVSGQQMSESDENQSVCCM